MKTQRIFDNKVDCYCNVNDNHCVGSCRCYCHFPIWYRNLIWKTQDIKIVGDILVIFVMVLLQPIISIYLIFMRKDK